jgi:hypothetical protein
MTRSVSLPQVVEPVRLAVELVRSGLDLLAGIHGDRLIAVVGGRHDPLASGRLLRCSARGR